MRIKIYISFLLVFFLIVFFIFFKGLQNTNIYTPNLQIEKKIPIFNAETLKSKKKINSKEIFKKEKYFLLNIWASWCVPCKEEHKFLMRLSKQKNLEIIGLNYKDRSKNASDFLDKFGNPFNDIIYDKDGTIAIEWGAYGVPETFLIHDMKIIKKIIGPLNEISLLEIKKIIK